MATLTKATNCKAFAHPARPDSVRVLYDFTALKHTLSEHICLATGLTRYELSN